MNIKEILKLDFELYSNLGLIKNYKYIDKEDYYVTGLYVEEACYIVASLLPKKYSKLLTKESHKYFKTKPNKQEVYKVNEDFRNLCYSIVDCYKFSNKLKEEENETKGC